jgi:antitoxin MazE
MRIKLIAIGNSKGIRLPGAIIRQFNLEDEIELVTGKDGIWIKPSVKNREHWASQFKKASSAEPTAEKDEWTEIPNSFDENEWEW